MKCADFTWLRPRFEKISDSCRRHFDPAEALNGTSCFHFSTQNAECVRQSFIRRFVLFGLRSLFYRNVKGASLATGATGNSRLIELSLKARSAGLPAHNQTIIQLTSAAPGIPVTSSAQQLRNCETAINPQSVDFRLFTLECNKARPCVFVRQWKYQQTGPVQSAAVTLPVACVTSRVFC